MLINKSLKYRIYPNNKQIKLLNNNLEGCRLLYNQMLNQRKEGWEQNKQSYSCYDQQKYFKDYLNKEEYNIHAQAKQNVAVRVDLAFKAFFKRVKNKENPGYPRFRSYGRYDSFTYPQTDYGYKIKDKEIYLSKIGNIKAIIHKSIEGKIKTCTVKKEEDKWFIILSYETESTPYESNTNLEIGIDVGLSKFAVFSDTTFIDNPRFFKQEEKNIGRLQRRKEKASSNQKQKLKKAIQKRHSNIKNKRKDFCHKLSRLIINKYKTICIEDLNINQMKENMKYLSKNIHDASWKLFLNFLIYKAEEAGRLLIQVNPAYTTQDCSKCGYRVKKKLSDRIHNCPNCGLSMDRDLNASINILRIGLYSLGIKSIEDSFN